MPLKTTKFDAAEYLETPDDIAVFLNDAIENGSPEEFIHALNTVARSVGMTKIAKEAGLGRQNLYKALGGEAQPEFATIFRVIKAAGVKLQIAA